MGQPARKIEPRTPAKRGGHLRVVRRAKIRAASPRGRSARFEAQMRTLFMSAVVVLVAAAGLGLVRVAVIARAAEMTINANLLLTDIKAQRVEAGQLEVDRSSLSTPSRLESIASVSMGMARPVSVRYIKMPTASTPAPVSGPMGANGASSAPAATDAIGGLLGALVDMSAGEAQSLLLGDVGLAGAR